MRFKITILIAFFVHTHWVCTQTTAAIPLETVAATSTESIVRVITEADIPSVASTPETSSDTDRTNQSNQTDVLSQSNDEKGDAQIAQVHSQLLELENQPESIEDASSEERRSIKTIRSVGEFRDALPFADKPVLIQALAPNGAPSPCSCYCPPAPPPCTQPPSYEPPAPVYAPAPLYAPPVPLYAQLPPPKFVIPKLPFVPLFPKLPLAPAPKYPPPSAYAHYRSADDDDDDEWEDSMTDGTKPRSAAVSYPAPVAYPEPPKAYTYPSPAPSVSCGQNLLVGCSPSVSNVPCSAAYSGQNPY